MLKPIGVLDLARRASARRSPETRYHGAVTSYARRQRQRERRIGSLPREGEIVVPIQRFLHVLVFVIGLILTLFGVTMLVGLGTGAVKPASIVLVPGVFFLAVSLRPILSSSSQLRADADGI